MRSKLHLMRKRSPDIKDYMRIKLIYIARSQVRITIILYLIQKYHVPPAHHAWVKSNDIQVSKRMHSANSCHQVF